MATTKKKAKKKVVSKKADKKISLGGEADFLTDLAMETAAAEKPKKKGTPEVKVNPTMGKLLTRFKKAKDAEAKAKAVAAEVAAELEPFAEERRVELSRSGGEHLSSVKLVASGAPPITYTKKNAYSGIPVTGKTEAISVVENATGADHETATALLDERIRWVPKTSINPALFKDEEAVAALKENPVLRKYLEVKLTGYPTAQFHQDATMDEQEGALMEALTELVKPHSPSFRAPK